jgi:hypothetical protein
MDRGAKKKTDVFGILLVTAVIGIFGYLCYYYIKKFGMGVGSKVQMKFKGCPTVLTSLLGGDDGTSFGHFDANGQYVQESSASPSAQDHVNAVYCDVDGSAGLRSSWLRNAGTNMQSKKNICAKATTNWGTTALCTSDPTFCNTISGLTCESNDDCPASVAECKNKSCVYKNTADSPYKCDAETGICMAYSKDGKPACPPPLTCTYSLNSPCSVSNMPCTGCYLGQTCKGSMSSGGVYTGTCTDNPYGTVPHVKISTDWLAEGTVSAVNEDGTVNVDWMAVQMLYPFTGPTKNWDYTQCRFIRSSEPNNAAIAPHILGTMSQDPTPTTHMYPGFESDPAVGTVVFPYGNVDNSSWSLISQEIKTSDLTPIDDFTIKNNAIDNVRTKALSAKLFASRPA